jgi:hypothetical protein
MKCRSVLQGIVIVDTAVRTKVNAFIGFWILFAEQDARIASGIGLGGNIQFNDAVFKDHIPEESDSRDGLAVEVFNHPGPAKVPVKGVKWDDLLSRSDQRE